VNGIILIDKAPAVTSHDVVDVLRGILNIKAIGHAGTLDPLATGLLVCLVGDATKLSQYVMAEHKTYQVDIKLGHTTDTGDILGAVTKESDPTNVTLEQIQTHAASLIGALELPVPKYSAVKVGGKKLYEYARKQKEVTVPIKTMTISKVTVGALDGDTVAVSLECEKGTYVRSWVERLGVLLGVGATVKSLRRLSSGTFHVNDSYKTEDVEALMTQGSKEFFIPMGESLQGWPALKLLSRDVTLVRSGQIPKSIGGQLHHGQWSDGVRLLNETGDLLALVVKDETRGIRLARVFQGR
jgi:tRNA pseudouridine55 synthase